MRYITINSMKSGMTLAMPFYDSNLTVLLGVGIVLNQFYMKRIRDLGYAGVYIEDEISSGITTTDVIPVDLRLDTIKAARDTIQQAERGEAAKVTRDHQNKIILAIIEEIIKSPTRLVDLINLKPYDDYMHYHTANVVILSILVGIEMGISGLRLYELGMATLLHDVGNIFIPKSILNKPGNLTPEEFDVIKSHSQMGFDYLREHFDISIEGCMGALQHHENYDGTGYPNKLKKDKISIYGRIIAITDVYDALTSRRPFRDAVFTPAALDYIDANSGTKFDPDIVAALKRVVAFYPVGCCVELDNGLTGIVVENYHGDTARPKVKLFIDSTEPMYADLHSNPAYSNVNVLEIIDY